MRAVNPLALTMIGLLAVVASLGVREVQVAALTLATELLLAVAFVPQLHQAGRRMLPVALAAGSVGFSTWLLGGHDQSTASTAVLRILVLALPGAVLAPLVDPQRLGDYLAQQLHLPARVVVAASAALQRFDSLGEVWSTLDRARRARGFGPGRSPVDRLRHAGALTFGLLVETLRGAGALSLAMDARGFAAASTRSWAEPARWARRDTAAVTVGFALAALPYVLSAVLG
ncbi:MAG: energy-coupling factor transporter transmembrane component T family protein [Nocardioidaceae bacterium]